MKKIIAAIILIIITVFSAVILSANSQKAKIFGENTNLNTAYIFVSQEKIQSVKELFTAFDKFYNLKNVNLDGYKINISDAKKIKEIYPDVKFEYETTAEISGKVFSTNAENIDLSDVKVENAEQLSETLPYFGKLKTVSLGQNALPIETIKELKNKYEDVNFSIIAVYDVFGKQIREDVEQIDLRQTAIDDSLYELLPKFYNLKYVDFHGMGFSLDTQIKICKAFPNIKFGWEVDLGNAVADTKNEIVYLNKTNMSGCAERIIKAAPALSGVKKVEMCDCGLSNEEMAQIREACPDIKIVWRVYLGKWSLKTDAVAFSVLIYTYNYRPMRTEDIQVLKYCTDLKALDLGHQAIADISVIGEYLKDLRVLILADNSLTDLTPLANLPHLHYLEFFVNNVTDLTPLSKCTQLVDLNISYNHNLSDITPLLNLPKLERLWLEHIPVSDESVQKLRNTYPNAKIVSQGTGSIDQGWRVHERYYAMMDMYLHHNDWIGEEFTKYD